MKDAEKFVRSHGSIIERAPLQTYGSALVFSPTKSKVRNEQWKERLSFIKMVAGIKDRWSAHQQTLEGHSDYVNAVTFSLDGKTLASASSDHTIRLWDAATGAHQKTLEGHSNYVNAVTFSPDGKTLASASSDRTIRLWDAATGAHQKTLEANRTFGDLVFSEDGQYLKTNYGLFRLSLKSTLPNKYPKQKPLDYALFVDEEWVTLDGKNYLWLPKDYRATCVAIYSHIAVLGHSSGGLTILQFAIS